MTDKERFEALLDKIEHIIDLKIEAAINDISENPGIPMGHGPSVYDLKKEILEIYFPDAPGEDL
jgi:hypothetical protein